MQKFIKSGGLFVVLVAALAICGTAVAAAKWQLLGERVVSYTVDHDVIPVPAYEGRFRKIGFTVRDNDVRFRKIVIHFENGGKQEINQNQFVRQGKRSKAINLAGERRRIDRISIWYDTVGFDGRATVRAYGQR